MEQRGALMTNHVRLLVFTPNCYARSGKVRSERLFSDVRRAAEKLAGHLNPGLRAAINELIALLSPDGSLLNKLDTSLLMTSIQAVSLSCRYRDVNEFVFHISEAVGSQLERRVTLQ
ncbi:hypothetical protein RRG08_053481 [Elysia crispata]|uniref:Uncharacterized protein n=1 Tax=Elysia crispata TaxID=231223 RepID=A0AAE1A165_9GAST|nr:hypothetical protein RRG08_053481 [Elysia crispata]